MSHSYPTPPFAATGLTWNPETYRFQGADNTSLRIRYFKNIGWEISAFYAEHKQHEQQYTGAQARLPENELIYEEHADLTIMHVPQTNECLHIQRQNGGLCFRQNEQTYLAAPNPFSMHKEAVPLYEGIMSLKVTDFSDRSPFGPIGAVHQTRMLHFQYCKPAGPIIGLPGQAGEANRDGYRFQLYNTDTFMHTPDRPPMYQSWPILFHRDAHSDGWTCVFHDNPSRTFVDVGDFYPEHITFMSQSGVSRVYVLHGISLIDVSRKLTTLLGGCPMPPEWAFGYQQCRWSYMDTTEIRSVARRMQEEKIPCTALYFDIDYMHDFRVFTHDKKRFIDLRECIDELHEQGYKTLCIVDPAVKVDEEDSTYKRVLSSGMILKNADQSPFIGKVWPGNSIYPDFKEAAMQELWSDIQQDWLKRFPFDGVWNDMNEPSNFDGQNASTSKALHADGTSVQLDWNLYGYHMASASRLGMKKAQRENELVITRAGYPGVQQYAVIWHGDNQAWWEHLRMAVDMTIGFSLCGAFYTGPDVPGFTGNPPDDLAIRFFQLGAWLPLFRGHSIYFAKDKEPYAFSPNAREHIYRAIRDRAARQKEWIKHFQKACATNTSPILPIFSNNGRLVRDQFLLFNTYVVAPIVERDQEMRTVYLPEGTWKRVYGEQTLINGGCWIAESISLENIPVFCRIDQSS